jgi:hypothetical protein
MHAGPQAAKAWERVRAHPLTLAEEFAEKLFCAGFVSPAKAGSGHK